MTCLSGQQFPLPQPYIQTSPTANASWPATSPPAVGQTTRHATPTQARHADADAWGQCLAWVARVCRAHTILPPLLAYPYSVRASTASTTYSVALTGQGPRCRFAKSCLVPEGGRVHAQRPVGASGRPMAGHRRALSCCRRGISQQDVFCTRTGTGMEPHGHEIARS